MRKHVFGVGLFIIVALTVGARGQALSATFMPTQPNQVNANCDFQPVTAPVMKTCVDWVDVQAGVIAGWSGDLNTGHAPLAVQLWRQDPVTRQLSGVWDASIVVERPDVAAYLGTTDTALGWGIVTGGPLTAGDYFILVTDVPYSQYCAAAPGGGIWCGYAADQIHFFVVQ